MASSGFARCRAVWMPGANVATRSMQSRSLSPAKNAPQFFQGAPFSHVTLQRWATRLQARQDDPALRLVLPLLVLVTHFTVFIGFEEDHLAQPFIRINLRGQRCRVAAFQDRKR